MPRGNCTNENYRGKPCPKLGFPQTIGLRKPFKCATCGAALIDTPQPKSAVVARWSFEKAEKTAEGGDVYHVRPNLTNLELPDASSRTLQIDAPSAALTVRVFSYRRFAPANRQMVMLVCHGRQKHPAATSGGRGSISAFAFLVPLHTSLFRQSLGTDGARQAATKFATAPLAFATAGVPAVYIGHHGEKELENSTVVGLHRVLPVCDVAIVVGCRLKLTAGKDEQDDEKVPLVELLEGTALGTTYRHFLMMCCRSPWPQPMVTARSGEVGYLYSFNDDFRISAEE